ncbi:hypothetical protein HIV01_009545 [Lysobacter arenosi]|uniref:Lipoprotein n=1 Tax=Lysobacter arenosi TaxID=2795387 RepID=A0ABX7R5W6_9GAMM|nr:hypothetical protein [Lysobacter arenosi]QSX73508.1 hypothetical protein HIV01_009545 [Lysobacter arenosi]
MKTSLIALAILMAVSTGACNRQPSDMDRASDKEADATPAAPATTSEARPDSTPKAPADGADALLTTPATPEVVAKGMETDG